MELTTYKTAAKTDASAIYRIIKGLREIGWQTLRLNDGEVIRTVDSDEPISSIVADLTATDESALTVTKDGKRATMSFCMGNEPWEVMYDCSYFDGWNEDLKLVEDAINLEGVTAH